jgi:hypothetical protein
MKLGERWHTDPRFEQWFHRFHLVVEVGLLIVLIWFIWVHLSRRRAESEA